LIASTTRAVDRLQRPIESLPGLGDRFQADLVRLLRVGGLFVFLVEKLDGGRVIGRRGAERVRVRDRVELRAGDLVFESLRRADQAIDRRVGAEQPAIARPKSQPAIAAPTTRPAAPSAPSAPAVCVEAWPISARARVPALMLRPTELSVPSNFCSALCRSCVNVVDRCAWLPSSFVAFASVVTAGAASRAA
jgi:hypothetical protein